MRIVVFVLLMIGAFGQWLPSPYENPQYLKYNCTVLEQSFNSTTSLTLENCRCGCSSQYFVCNPNVVNDYCCQSAVCQGAQFQTCFQKQIQCNSVYMILEVSPIVPNAPKNFTLRQVYQAVCDCDDQDCNERTSRYRNQEFVECWTDGNTILLELENKNSKLSAGEIVAIIFGCIAGVIFIGVLCCKKEMDEENGIRRQREQMYGRQDNQREEPKKQEPKEEQKKEEPKNKPYLYGGFHASNISQPNIEQPKPECQRPPSYTDPYPQPSNPPEYEEGAPHNNEPEQPHEQPHDHDDPPNHDDDAGGNEDAGGCD